jgi:hypothetical protein
MAASSGIKGTLTLTAGNITSYSPLYTVGSNTYGVYNVSFTNTGASTANIRLVVGASTYLAVTASEIIEYQTAVVPNGVFERTGLVLQAGTNIVVSSTGTAMNVNIYGIETSTT